MFVPGKLVVYLYNCKSANITLLCEVHILVHQFNHLRYIYYLHFAVRVCFGVRLYGVLAWWCDCVTDSDA